MMTRLLGTFGLLAFVWGNTQAIATSTEYVAQVTAGVGINRPSLKAGSQGTAVSELQAVLKLLGYYTGAVDGDYGQSTATAVSQFQKAAGLNPDGIVNAGTWERLFPLVPTASAAAAFPVPATTTRTPPPAANTSVPNTTRVTNSKPAQTAATATKPSTPKPAQTAATATKPSTPKPAKTPASTEVNLPVLRLAMRSAAVKKLQQRLQVFGLFKGSVDGVFGPQTEIAVKALQSRYRLNPDGVVGPATWKVLNRQPPRTR
ncbi:MAG: peptidoglycan-binding protein [Gloeocapsa sp. UFS-A4-WI-NPMV-4B04]|jgi:peptidoglycan hydrolase-like protein with peptidoglycan-binding domain|nr:peptidoglycan-binding protein [Gloeocapsa sp. UFS-A4-WI-NPMV-4B04]